MSEKYLIQEPKSFIHLAYPRTRKNKATHSAVIVATVSTNVIQRARNVHTKNPSNLSFYGYGKGSNGYYQLQLNKLIVQLDINVILRIIDILTNLLIA